MSQHILIAGAGVAGGALASGLQELPDVTVTTLEASGPDDHEHAGNGLNVGPNALRALEASLPELASELKAVGRPWQRWQAQLADGTPLYAFPLRDVADRDGIRIRWSELYRVVRRGAAQSMRFHTVCRGVHPQADGRLTVELARPDGDSEILPDVDRVIAGDGRYSALRETLVGKPVPRHRGIANFRALVEDGQAIALEDMEQWFNGPRRLIAFRMPDARIYVSGNLPIVPGQPVPEVYRDPTFLRHAYTDGYEQPDPRLDALAEVFARHAAQMHWARAQEVPLHFRALGGRVLFIGDAAHGMCPTLGQGATQALEDAAVLLRLFQQQAPETADSVAAFGEAYERLRRERVEFVQRFSWDASDALVFGADPVAANRAKAGPDYRTQWQRLYTDIPMPSNRIDTRPRSTLEAP